MNSYLERLLNRFDRRALEREVEEELRFHIEMQAHVYESQGVTPPEAHARAVLRFGDFAQVKTQCVRIGKQNSVRTWAMKFLFTTAFLLGVSIRVMSSEFHLTRVGDLMIVIAVFGGLLLYGKQTGTTMFRPKEESFRLGLNNGSDSMPLGFDEEGRTPFERVRAEDR